MYVLDEAAVMGMFRQVPPTQGANVRWIKESTGELGSGGRGAQTQFDSLE